MIYIGSDKPEVGRTSEWNVYVYYKFFFFFRTQERGQRRSYVTVSFFNCVYLSSKNKTHIFLVFHLALEVLA